MREEIITKSYLIDKGHKYYNYGLTKNAIAKIRSMEDYGKITDFIVKDVKSTLWGHEVTVSFKDIPDDGFFCIKEVLAENAEQAIYIIKKNIPAAKDITVCGYINSPHFFKKFLVSYYIVTHNT